MAKLATFYDHIRDIARQENCFVVDALSKARELGIQAVEASANNILGREDEFGQELAMTDMEISAIPAYFDFGRDQDVKQQATPILEAAQFLGASRLLVIPGFWDAEDTPQQREDKTARMTQCVAQLGELALEYGLSLVMEEYDNKLSPIADIAGVRRFLDDCPSLDCAFDTGNFRFAGEDVLEAYDRLRDRIGHVHLKDRSYTSLMGEEPYLAVDQVGLYPAPVGAGDLPVAEVMNRLKQDDYDGIYTIEHYGAKDQWDCLRRSVEWVKTQLGM
ncbi:MAG: sugar phosphate isomerase/epimerase family protein [Acutalibacter sp.]|jgi:L-ribulose-5-phosphate 3-epimerase